MRTLVRLNWNSVGIAAVGPGLVSFCFPKCKCERYEQVGSSLHPCLICPGCIYSDILVLIDSFSKYFPMASQFNQSTTQPEASFKNKCNVRMPVPQALLFDDPFLPTLQKYTLTSTCFKSWIIHINMCLLCLKTTVSSSSLIQ